MHRLSRLSRFALLPALFVLLGALNACGNPASGGVPTGTSAPPVTLNVFAAASLTSAFKEIGQHFQTAHPNVTVTFNFAGSNALATQINQGAPADVFASANQTQMNNVVKAGAADASASKIFARNLLVVITPKNNPAQITALQDLARPGIKLVIAAPSVPAGQYAVDFFTKASADPSFPPDYKDNVTKNVISQEADVESVVTKVAQGEADAGIVYVTDALANVSQLNELPIPTNLQTVAVYPIAPLKGSKNPTTAQQFVDYVLGSEGQAIMAKYGFMPPNG